ncbi:MAG: MmcQ/YjbR family DNA-binding protein [Ignavibacteria bacterium]|jgi:predicted DNA-binding protein (MmcQ/YjbR family)
MDVEEIREYCLSKKAVTEGFPFNETALVFKVMNKMFALLNLERPYYINLKCDPENTIELREKYEFVIPGYHMNKKHWNTVELESSVKRNQLTEWIDHSYELVVSSFARKVKAEYDETE